MSSVGSSNYNLTSQFKMIVFISLLRNKKIKNKNMVDKGALRRLKRLTTLQTVLNLVYTETKSVQQD